MNLSTGTHISGLPTGTIDALTAILPISIGMPNSPQTIQASLSQVSQFLSQYGYMTGTYVPRSGYISENAAQLTYITGTSYRMEAGAAEVNGSLLTWASPITRSGLSLTADTLYYIYLYSNSGTPALEESTTVPVWDSILNYYKKTGDATRRYVGFIEASATDTLRKFLNIVQGRISEFTYIDGADPSIDKRPVNAGTSSASWASFSLAPLVPVLATHFFGLLKTNGVTSGDDAILGVSPIDLGSSVASTAPHMVRIRADAATGITFFGSAWLPIQTPQTYYYRLQHVAGTTTTAFVEIHGARIIR